jgi:hypothetical protein
MATITEDYVSFKVAKLLKEKGFDEPCRSYFIDNVDYVGSSYSAAELTDLDMGVWETLRPTHQMAMKWLREVHNIHISVYVINRELQITNAPIYTCDIATEKLSSKQGHLRGIWKSYEEAVEAAIKYTLENLI